MSAPVSQAERPLSSQARLSRRLLRAALDTLSVVSAAERPLVLADIDRFVAQPSPAHFLMAMRRLQGLRQATALRSAQLSRAEQEQARGLQSVRRELGAAVADALLALPLSDPAEGAAAESESELAGLPRLPTASTGARLRSLALLLAAHHELADRVAGRADALRQHLARAKDAHEQKQSKPAPRRKSPEPRPPRQSTVTSTKS
jgi:hypothetical protein